ncbi:hypothetical protein [Heliorestis convoluta]|uniref:Putative membrane protein n=1 Tax=Heliorestis convoluta TaxID=356322 RepID=A0A5Q2N0M0_9FIRM|nr:hypothetical protein [Heliorestis convoluta]QGG48548.1 putative membrane protein [Heliorestis convoluta]
MELLGQILSLIIVAATIFWLLLFTTDRSSRIILAFSCGALLALGTTEPFIYQIWGMRVLAPLFAGWAVAYSWIFPKTLIFGALFYYITILLERIIGEKKEEES